MRPLHCVVDEALKFFVNWSIEVSPLRFSSRPHSTRLASFFFSFISFQTVLCPCCSIPSRPAVAFVIWPLQITVLRVHVASTARDDLAFCNFRTRLSKSSS